MPEQQKQDGQQGSQPEATLQADPMLREGRVSRWRWWAYALGIVVVLAVVIYGVTRSPVPRVPDFTSESTTTGGGPTGAPPAGGGAGTPSQQTTGSGR